ncbi:MAG: SDR family oxidoreductase [Alicyclobacillaceae bacterium]|nr:SDR family oxidoreductase [Alicyclobacillaceae bacterium]
MPHHPSTPARTLSGQVAIVTGASRGIGRAIALALAEAGAQVVVNYRRSRAEARQVVERCEALGVRALAVAADVSNPGEVKALAQAARTLGTVSILVNNAGVAATGLLLETPLDTWREVIDTHLTGAFLCCRAVLPGMIRQGYGRIVNISSVWGMVGAANEVAYSAAKGGVIAFTKALAKEVARAGVTVNAVAPGAVATDMLSSLQPDEQEAIAAETPVGRIGRPEDVAHAVLYLVSPGSSFVTGQVLSPNGGWVT